MNQCLIDVRPGTAAAGSGRLNVLWEDTGGKEGKEKKVKTRKSDAFNYERLKSSPSSIFQQALGRVMKTYLPTRRA